MEKGSTPKAAGAGERPYAAFAAALNAELDAIGFVRGRERGSELASLLGLQRTQSYRILTGVSGPTIEWMGKLRSAGISMDRVLDQSNSINLPTIDIYVNGDLLPAVVQKGRDSNQCTVALVPHEAGFKLTALKPGQAAAKGAIPIQGLQFAYKDTLAILEDHADTLELLNRQMSAGFRTAAFDKASKLLDRLKGTDGFSAFLIDWRLPGDIDGEELVQLLRKNSTAPIFILTGDKGSSESIARAMDQPNVHHVVKPADPLILMKRITQAIKHNVY